MITNRVVGETQQTRLVCVTILHGLCAAFLPAEMGQAPSGMREAFVCLFVLARYWTRTDRSELFKARSEKECEGRLRISVSCLREEKLIFMSPLERAHKLVSVDKGQRIS